MKVKILTMVALVCLGFTMNAQEKIFYVAKSVSNYYTIFSINPDGTDKVQIFDDTWHRSGVNITSDGEMFYLKREYFDITHGGQTLLCKSNIDGTNESILWAYPDSATLNLRGQIDLSSDKQKVIYSTYQAFDRDGDVFELDLTTFTSTNISNNNDYPPQGIARYSADNSKVLFIELATDWYAYPWNMFLINVDGTNRVQLTPDANESYYCPNFSNDGTKIIYCSYTGLTTPLSLYIANSDGSNGQQVIPSSGASNGIWHPTFSPDDTKILFYRAGNLVISQTNGNILSEFPVETIEDQSNIVWVKVDNFTISFDNQTAKVGRTIEIPILTSELESSDNIIAYQFDFNYDNTKLEYLSNTLTGTLAEGGSLQLNPTTGKLSIAWARQTPMVGEGAIIKLQFKVIDSGATTPTITNALYNTEAVNATNGTITATYKYGDIDANDHVQAYDAALAIQYSVGLDPLPTIDPLPWENWRIVTANVDGVDGVTANDASEILKYTVGLITEFPVENTKKMGTASNADISVSVQNGEIVLTSTGELFGLNVFVNENFSVLGEPEIFVEGALLAKNISETNYAFGLATAYSPENNVDIIKIPYSTTQDQVVTFDFIVNTKFKSVTVGLTTGIVTINEQSVIIYPNPANSLLYLKGVENVNVTIFDISGREVLNQLNINKQIDISALPNGIYTVKIENGNENITRKLIKN